MPTSRLHSLSNAQRRYLGFRDFKIQTPPKACPFASALRGCTRDGVCASWRQGRSRCQCSAGERVPGADASRKASASRAGRAAPPEVQMQTFLALAAVRMAAKRAAEVPVSSGSMKRRALGGVAHALGCLAETLSQFAIMGGNDGDGPDFGSETSLMPYTASDGPRPLLLSGGWANFFMWE